MSPQKIATILAALQAAADFGLKAAEIATRYHTGGLRDAELLQEWSAMRIDQAQAERTWREAGGEAPPLG